MIARAVLPTEAGALVEYFRGIRGTIHVTFEEGTQAQWLHDLFEPVVHRVLVCDRRGRSQHGNKGDHRDAGELSDLLQCGKLRAVYHGSSERATLEERARTYQNLVEDSTRVMLRLKALFRARGIKTPGTAVCRAEGRRAWLGQLDSTGRAVPGEGPVCRARGPAGDAAEGEGGDARRSETRSGLGRAAHHSVSWARARRAVAGHAETPWRFRTKRHLWAYAGLAVVTRTSAEYEVDRQRKVMRHRRRFVQTRGLNRNHNRVVKDVFKAAATAASARSGALQRWYEALLTRVMREELARVTLARKLAAITLRLWKRGERYDSTRLTGKRPNGRNPGGRRWGVRPRGAPVRTWGGSESHPGRSPGQAVPPRHSPKHRPFRRTRISVRPILRPSRSSLR